MNLLNSWLVVNPEFYMMSRYFTLFILLSQNIQTKVVKLFKKKLGKVQLTPCMNGKIIYLLCGLVFQ